MEIKKTDTEMIDFIALFFPDGKLSRNELSLKVIVKDLDHEEAPLIASKRQEAPDKTKIRGKPEYDHVRYLKNKFNDLMGRYIEEFLVLKKNFYPNPDLF